MEPYLGLEHGAVETAWVRSTVKAAHQVCQMLECTAGDKLAAFVLPSLDDP